jgi:anti-sigma regulatory factor (Ser/Thr protein kinase)
LGATRGAVRREVFRHDALLYEGEDEFVDRSTAFIREGIEEGEPVLVIVVPEKIDLLRSALDGDVGDVLFADMAEIGRNPSRIIPVWQDFVTTSGSGERRVRGIGEPIWAGRGPAALVESQHHESLMNLAFAGAPAWIRCSYDASALEPNVIAEAWRSHPTVLAGGSLRHSETYRDLDGVVRPFTDPLPEPAAPSEEITLGSVSLGPVRAFINRKAEAFGLAGARVGDAVVAVNEVVTNTLRHAGGGGVLRVWTENDAIVFEVRDRGYIANPLAGRRRPEGIQEGGFGLWLVNQLCDLVQIRSTDAGSVVRMHMSRREGGYN